MNNIQQAFKAKSGLRQGFSAGSGMRTSPSAGLRLALGAGNVKKAAEEAADDAHNAQLVDVGGIVKDKDGEHDVDTKDVVLADGEAVLPWKTVRAMGGPKKVEQLITMTNGKPPAGSLRDGLMAAQGATPEEGERVAPWVKPGADPAWAASQNKVYQQNAPAFDKTYAQQKALSGPGDIPLGNEGLSRALGNISSRAEQARVDNTPGFTGAMVSGDPNPGMGGYSVQGRSNVDATRLQAPNGGGFITGQPDAQGLRKAAFIPGDQTPYIAADGTATGDWTKTSAYGDATARAAREQQQLAALVADKAATGDRNGAYTLARGVPGMDALAKQGLDRFSAMSGLNAAGKAAFIAKEQEAQGIAGLRAAQTQLAQVQAGQAGKLSPKDLFEMQRQAKNDAQAQANTDRTHVTGRTDHAEKSIDDLLRQHATVGKDFDPQRYATLKKWEANFGANNADRLNNPNRYATEMLRMLADESRIQERGRHNLTSENDHDGSITTLRKAAPSLKTLVQPGNWSGQVYEDTNGQGLRLTLPSNMSDKDRERIEYTRVVGEDGLTGAQRDQLKSQQKVAAR